MSSRPAIVGELTDNAKKFCLVAKVMLRWIISYHFAKYKSIMTFLTSIFIPTISTIAVLVSYVRGPSGPLDQALGFEGRSFRGDAMAIFHQLSLRPVHPEIPKRSQKDPGRMDLKRLTGCSQARLNMSRQRITEACAVQSSGPAALWEPPKRGWQN